MTEDNVTASLLPSVVKGGQGALVNFDSGDDLLARPDFAQFLTFMLAGEVFAIGILSVKEIIEYSKITEVPSMPECVRGVINLRGAVVPVVDLQVRFGRRSNGVTKRTCIVIVEVGHGQGSQVIGVVVDAVNEVLDIGPDEIKPPPVFGARIRADFIQGIGNVRNGFVIILDVGRVFSLDELDVLAEVA